MTASKGTEAAPFKVREPNGEAAIVRGREFHEMERRVSRSPRTSPREQFVGGQRMVENALVSQGRKFRVVARRLRL